MRSPQSFLELKLATPPNHGDIVQFPGLEKIESSWNQSLHVTGADINGRPIGQIQTEARRELLAAAFRYSRQYGDFQEPDDSAPITMAGHQPDLYHPGVWYKNFVLSNIARRFQSNAVNLIVDNDVCANHAIAIPQKYENAFSMKYVPYDVPSVTVPFEERCINNLDLFQSFGRRATSIIQPVVKKPIVNRLWELISKSVTASRENNLGICLARGRHQLERESGLNTLEVPLSEIADSKAFVEFSFHILSYLDSFQAIYNRSVELYRKVFRVRSDSHPVPNLRESEGFLEAPFWVWERSNPQRRQLFARNLGDSLVLTDRHDWNCTISKKELDHQQFVDLRQRGVKIRPRALITTMYCRLLLSNLFVHGIGGAKYDRLTDYICEQFFGILPPPFLAVSATMKLRPDTLSPATIQDLAVMRRTIREMEFHPEKFVAKEQFEIAQPWVDKKKELISSSNGHRFDKQQFEKVEDYNQKLKSFILAKQQQIKRELHDKRKKIDDMAALNSRETSFSLFPETLIGELHHMAAAFNR